MRLQLNAAIKSDTVKVERIGGSLNIAYVAEKNDTRYLKSIPVLWGEYGGQATKDDIDTIKQQVGKLYDDPFSHEFGSRKIKESLLLWKC